ncbi:HTH-type transcriptional repressor CytR [Pseudoruegeria aquimaris]|uniref:HTH-type transcriptional repressor CytR n=1 Tax=Pseudoruegeria aquimaris TaxID=393663 RepID=A0A1Y5SW90_9RHOB|nr:LacI family DNA-binding transcriptional regulator [Pseudoruegeria aquimaris]SLN49832.1 HTH-type transcriptional repressor CytR [Pseudoruegeria aquimaris]
MSETVKIQDVAKAAGVSTATVSRTLSNPSVVSERTRKAVLEAVRATGYRVNRAARNLRTQRTGSILTLIPNIGNPFFSQIIAGIEQVFSEAEYSVLVSDTANIGPAGTPLSHVFQDGRADGVIVLDGILPLSSIESVKGTPNEHLVIYACEWAEGAGIPSIRSDNRSGAIQAVNHLADLGHRAIGHICGPEDNVLTGVRRAAFFEAAEARGLDVRPEWVFPGDFKLASGAAAAEAFLGLKERPTAVFSASDLMAMGFISRLSDAGVRVPEDLSVVGFDDIDLAPYFRPALTTIRQDRMELGRITAQTLLSRLRRPTEVQPDFLHIVPVELVERASTAAPAR